MTVLDRYLLARTLGALARTLFALVFLYVVIDLLTHRRDNILKYDIPWQTVAGYYAAFVPGLVYRLAPLSMLVSALLVLGDAAQNNEVTAALSGGVSLRRLVRAPVAVALALAIGLFAMDQTVGAVAAREALRIEENYFTSRAKDVRQGISWANLSEGWTVHISKFNRIALTGERVILHASRADSLEHIQARRIYWDETRARWVLEDGYWNVLTPDASSLLSQKRITQHDAPLEETPEELFALERPAETKTAEQLARDIAEARARRLPTDRARVDFHAKFSQPALSFVMILLAVPFALRLRRGGLAISFGASIAIAIAYLVVYTACIQLGYLGRLEPVVAAWLANVLFLAAGAVLFLRTPT
jgi:lipopolysaccharide export system permease protein